ncbi:protein regulator of cytokinesis 1 isoform X2 [Rana temporaria]|uniref:protein regulator of cytokinesis 1 isoform X2 n=1 Tax=Rana temporaria TaxID=8407 RepID=UPI001AAD9385|nr:protein regulator of cytokinesis 1 isoform X2 [Rana temporaria]
MRRSEAIAAESVACLNSALTRLRDIWEEIGIPEDQRLQRTDAVKRHVNILLTRMIEEEENLRERLLKSIDVCRKELFVLCNELHLPPFEADEESTILQLEKDMRTRVEVMLKQKKERIQELKQLKQRDQELCDILCMTPYFIDIPVPSLDELDQFRRHLAALCAEKERREAEFVKTKKQIILCMEELDRLPDTSFERDVVCVEQEAFCLSKENLEALHELLFQLEEKIGQNRVLSEELRSKIVELWDRLGIPEEERNACAAHMTGSKGKTIQALQDELDRLQELKMQNIKNVIEVIRTEIKSYWDKCFYGDEQRQAFVSYYDENYGEDLLSLHDAEINHLKEHYEVHKEMFEGVNKWEENWNLFLELDKKATDPNRYNNRGGNLLKEEKQRAKIQKMLPKLEEELKFRIEAWEEEQQQEFFVNGKKFMDYVAEQWNQLQLEKEREKQERLMKKSRQLEEEMHFGSAPRTPNKRRVLGSTTTTTPNNKVRKLNGTYISNTTNSTLRSAFSGTLCHSPVTRPPPSGGKAGLPIRTPTRVFKTPQPRKFEKNKENVSTLNGTAISGGCHLSIPAQRNHSVNSVASTYSEFARELSKATRADTNLGILNSTISNM